MKFISFFTFLLLLICSTIKGQSYIDRSTEYSEVISSSEIKELVYKLASPEFEGRETGTAGNELAANFIAVKFKSYGIPPYPGSDDYFQHATFTNVTWKDLSLAVNGSEKTKGTDYLAIPQSFPKTNGVFEIREMTFIGYGIDDPKWSDYNDVDVRGKHIMIFSSEPMKNEEDYLLTNGPSPSRWSDDPSLRVKAAFEHGAASVWVVNENIRDLVMSQRRGLISGFMIMGTTEKIFKDKIPNITISPTLAQEITGDHTENFIKARKKLSSGKQISFTFPVNISFKAEPDASSIDGLNVLGFIEGTDPVLKDEVVVVSGHYDHLGKRGNDIFFGADDNASGTSAVLQVAKAMAQAKKDNAGPKRSVLCILVTGEEKGLLGSNYYCENPVFPLKNTVADVNIDMIGRVDDKHDSPNYTYVIGSDRLSTTLDSIIRDVNQKYTKLDLDYTYNAKDDPNQFYYRSDHYNFAKNGIPVVFFFSGVHDDYHRPTDTPDKIMYDKATVISKLAFHVTWDLANRADRIQVNVREMD